MKSEDMKDEWEEADAKQQQQVEEHEHDERSSSCTEKYPKQLAYLTWCLQDTQLGMIYR